MSVNEEGIDGMIHFGKNDFVQVQSKKEKNELQYLQGITTTN